MLHFTRYAEKKFEILNKYQVFYTKEQIEDCLAVPDKVSKKGRYLAARKDGIKVVFRKEGEVIRIITFYPCLNG